MFTERTSVGLDVHGRSVAAAAIDGSTGELVQARLTASSEQVVSWVQGLHGPVAVAYEAGPTGFDLARHVVPPESWRASLCGFPVGGRGVLVIDRAHHAGRAVPALVVVEPVAPVQHDGLSLAGVLELVA